MTPAIKDYYKVRLANLYYELSMTPWYKFTKRSALKDLIKMTEKELKENFGLDATKMSDQNQ